MLFIHSFFHIYRSGSTASVEKSGEGARRRSSTTKERSKSQTPEAAPTTAAATTANTKLIEAEKAETGKVILEFFQLLFLNL